MQSKGLTEFKTEYSHSPSFEISGRVMILIIPMAIIALTERNVLIFARSSMFWVIAPHSVPYGIFTQVYPRTSMQALVKENASTVQSQETYLKRYENLTKRYGKARSEWERLQDERTRWSQRNKTMALYIHTLKKQPLYWRSGTTLYGLLWWRKLFFTEIRVLRLFSITWVRSKSKNRGKTTRSQNGWSCGFLLSDKMHTPKQPFVKKYIAQKCKRLW